MRGARIFVLVAISLLALASCSRGNRSTNPSPQPAVRTTSSPARVPAPAISAEATPTATGSPLHALLPPPPKRVPRLPSDAAPQILDVAVNETTVRPGDRVYGRVVTTSNVASVEARVGGYAMTLAKTGVGRFELRYQVGALPWFIRGNFTMQVIARNTRGDAVTRTVPFTVH
jgi:hypothetical protein